MSVHDLTSSWEAPFAPDMPIVPPAESLAGLSHDEVLDLDFPAERFLVDELVPSGAVGTIAGVPETHKSWLAQAITVAVASGSGRILGRSVSTSGPCGYIWQDDSTREEAERIKLYHRVREQQSGLPIRWFLNENVRLSTADDDIPRIRATVEQHGLVLLTIDSFYNVLHNVDLKDAGAEIVVSRLKQEVCDPTGCTILIVDHMPWATETNRQRLRAYGGVFKNAATRFGIYIDAQGKKLWLEARGNNMKGIPKSLAEWNAETLQVELVETDEHVGPEDYEQRIVDYLSANPWPTTTELDAGVSGRGSEIRAARARLTASGQIMSRSSQALGRIGRSGRWNLAIHAGLDPSHDLGTGLVGADPSHPSHRSIGTGVGTDGSNPPSLNGWETEADDWRQQLTDPLDDIPFEGDQ